MKQFFKFTTASCLGTLLAFGAIILIFTVIGSILGSKSADKVAANSVLKLDIKHVIPEKTGNVASSGGFSVQENESIGLHRLVDLIEHAKTDNSIEGIVIQGMQSGFGPASIFTIEKALREFKTSDKFVYAYGDMYSQQGYFLSSVADSIFMNELGMVDMRGFGTLIPFFKKAMDKYGIDMNIFYAGDFKSATEPFRGTEMSSFNKEQTRIYLELLSRNFFERIAENRAKSYDDVNACIDDFCLEDADAAIVNGFVDVLANKSEFRDFLKGKLGISKKSDKIKYIDIYNYHSKAKVPGNYSIKDQIAVVVAEGTVAYKTDGKGVISEDKYEAIFDKLIDNDKTKAVVLRVNSGGGSALTSDIIWSKIEELKESGKPVIASFGDYAASGGYYVACGADTIVAEANTLTGSIGVFSMFPKFKRLLEDKIGITFDTVKTSPMAVALNPVLDLSEQEKAFMDRGTKAIYERFLKVVSEGRNRTRDEIHEVAQGRIWIGSQAVENGLVDVLGDLDDAIAIAGEKAGLDKYRTRFYPEIKVDPFEQAIKEIMKSTETKLSSQEIKLLNQYHDLKEMVQAEGPQMRMPFKVEF